MSYQDDDGETTDILSDHDLTEAIQYFHAGADDNASTNGSILSGYSGRMSRRITLRLRVAVEYDGPSLSDTGSLVSLEDYPKHGHGSLSLSDVDSYDSHAFPLQELDDDAVTISSRDTPNRRINGGTRLIQRDLSSRFSESLSIQEEVVEISLSESNLSLPEDTSGSQSSPFLIVDTPATSKDQVSRSPSSATVNGKPELEPDGVFERLRMLDSDPFGASQQSLPLDANERGAQWLRDQTDRAAWHSFTTPKPSSNSLRALTDHRAPRLTMTESEFDAGSSSMSRDLELQKDDNGKYYYKLTPDPPSHLESERERSPRAAEPALAPDEHQDESRDILQDARVVETETFGAGPSTGAALFKRVSQVSHMTESGESSSSSGLRTRGARSSRLGKVPESGDISPELLQAILESESQSGPHLVTDCSSCGDILESFRYVCTTCGEKTAQTRESLALARSFRSEPSSATDPFADPSDSSSDIGLGLLNTVHTAQLIPPREEEDIADARSEASFATSSWASVDHLHSPNHSQTSEQPQSSSPWPSLFKPHSQDNRLQNDFPPSTFKQKLKKGFKRSMGGNPSSHGKSQGTSSVPEASNSTSGVSAPLRPDWNLYQQHPSFPTQPTIRHPRRPEVVIAARGSNRSDSSGGTRSNTSRSGSASTPTTAEPGYELCNKCIATAGVVHAESALSSAATPVGTVASHSFSSMSSLGSSPHEGQHSPSNTGAGLTMGSTDWIPSGASSVTTRPPRKPNRKVQIRHAYLEKFWGIGGWQDVGQ